MLKRFSCLLMFVIAIASCRDNKKSAVEKTVTEVPVEKRAEIRYQLIFPKDSIKNFIKHADSLTINAISAVNRADKNALLSFDTLIIPSDLKQDSKQYFPFPFYADFLKDINKIIFFSYPAQSFAAYEKGVLIRTGPTSMGRKADQTPTGLFYTNWKAEQTTSTFNDEWDLKWNFNIENKLGVGFHQYAMPGYPASHSCLRLKEEDAKYLYDWADQWKIEGTDNILAHGTPVIVFGAYPFGSPRPWLALAQNPDALMISEKDLQGIAASYMDDIRRKQEERESR